MEEGKRKSVGKEEKEGNIADCVDPVYNRKALIHVYGDHNAVN